MNLLGVLKGIFRWTWRILEGLQRILSLVLVVVVLMILFASLGPGELQQVPDSTALVLAPEGDLVDQLSGDPIDRAFARARGVPIQETLVKDLIDAIREGRDDDRVKVLVLQLNGLGSAGLSKLQDIADEILAFKGSGKPVVAAADAFSRDQYYLAAFADEIYMHPMGYVYMDGYSRYQPYYRSAIDKLLVDFHVWRVGEYKSFVEPILRDDMSPEDRESASAYLEALWGAYQSDVTAARGLPADALQRYADNAVEFMTEAEGNSGLVALNMDLVDELLSRDEISARIKALVGSDDEDENDKDNDNDEDEDERSYPNIGHADYLAAVRSDEPEPGGDDTVAVLVASGIILDGEQPSGTIGGESTSALIRQIADDDDVRALVLRVDSGGGSAFASELILRELEVFQRSGRPLVVSMGSVAASGGYWISMSADEIWASPATLTGSIGVGATLPTVPRMLDALGIHVDGLGTTELAGQWDPTRPLGPDIANVLEQSINYTYKDFITKVAQHRQQDVAAIDAVARGRVWIAPQAQTADLVDRLGNIDDAIASAAELAGLAEDAYEVRYVERELDFSERLALELIGGATPMLRSLRLTPSFSPRFQQLLDIAAEPLRWVDSLNDPKGIYAYCFCDAQ